MTNTSTYSVSVKTNTLTNWIFKNQQP